MELGLTRLEILLTTALVCALLGFITVGFLIPQTCPDALKTTIKTCNEIHLAMAAQCRIETDPDWDIGKIVNNTEKGQEFNLTIKG